MTTASQINMRHTVSKYQLAVTVETIEHERKSLISFDIARTLEIFIEHGADQIFRRRNESRRGDLIQKLPRNQTVVICEVNIDLHI